MYVGVQGFFRTLCLPWVTAALQLNQRNSHWSHQKALTWLHKVTLYGHMWNRRIVSHIENQTIWLKTLCCCYYDAWQHVTTFAGMMGIRVRGQWRVTNKKCSMLWAHKQWSPCFWTGDFVVRWHCLWDHDDYCLCNHDFQDILPFFDKTTMLHCEEELSIISPWINSPLYMFCVFYYFYCIPNIQSM